MLRWLVAVFLGGCWGATAGSVVGCILVLWLGIERISAVGALLWGMLAGLVTGALVGAVVGPRPDR